MAAPTNRTSTPTASQPNTMTRGPPVPIAKASAVRMPEMKLMIVAEIAKLPNALTRRDSWRG